MHKTDGIKRGRSMGMGRAGARAGNNRRLPGQRRRLLGKHYLNKYHAVKRGA